MVVKTKMKNLRQFQIFDSESFFKDKQFVYMASNDYFEYKNGEKTDIKLGVKVEAVIVNDRTAYKTDVTNEFEKINFKIENVDIFEMDKMARFTLNTSKIKTVTVFGQFQNQLSIVIDKSAIVPIQKA